MPRFDENNEPTKGLLSGSDYFLPRAPVSDIMVAVDHRIT